ncbi:kinase-like domain-containing protein, partial [Gigaspora rosea]
DKLLILASIANGLKIIHKEDLIHRDLHYRNILINNKISYISDFGLSGTYDQVTTDKKIVGILPFIAPEILEGKPCTQKSDVYSFGIIMWMFTSGSSQFYNHKSDTDLQLDIRNGIRPQIIDGTPPCFINLMKKCWDTKPENRPN